MTMKTNKKLLAAFGTALLLGTAVAFSFGDTEVVPAPTESALGIWHLKATGRNSDGFNQPSRATFVRQIRQNCELECTDQLSVVLHHDQLVIVVSIDRFERIVIALRERRFESFAFGSQRVICKESHYVGHVLTDRAADLTHGSLYPSS